MKLLKSFLAISIILNLAFGYVVYGTLIKPFFDKKYNTTDTSQVLKPLKEDSEDIVKNDSSKSSLLAANVPLTTNTKLTPTLSDSGSLEYSKDYFDGLISQYKYDDALKEVNGLLKGYSKIARQSTEIENTSSGETLTSTGESLTGTGVFELIEDKDLSELYLIKAHILYNKGDLEESLVNINNSILTTSGALSSVIIGFRDMVIKAQEEQKNQQNILSNVTQGIELEDKATEELVANLEKQEQQSKKERVKQEQIDIEKASMDQNLKEQKTLAYKDDLNSITENYLILGVHDKLTDTIMIASHNKVSNKLVFFNVPRDTLIFERRINYIYLTFGPEVLKQYIEYVTGLKISKYVAVDINLFPELVDSLGGIDIVNNKLINDKYYPAWDGENYEPFYLPAGTYHFNGYDALKYARSRKSKNSDDFDRSKRQQQVIVAVKQRISDNLKRFDLGFINDYFSIILKKVDTDIQPSEILSLYTKVKDVEFVTGNIISRDNYLKDLKGKYLGMYYLIPRKGMNNFYDIHKYIYNTIKDN